MSNDQKVQELANWLGQQLGGDVDIHHEFTAHTFHFRIEVPDVRPDPVLRVTRNAIDDWDLEEIQADLVRESVLDRLLSDSSMRLLYNNRREIPPIEPRSIRCDSRPYRIERDADHNVRIYDETGHLLENLPQTMLVMPESVFMKSEQRWCEEIRQWRGENQ